jgi:cytochrome b561
LTAGGSDGDKIRLESGYTPRQRHLHWIVAGLVTLQLVLGVFIGSTRPADHRLVLWVHAAVGSTIFVLMLLRWQLRQRVGAPRPPSGTYYVLLLALPVIGWFAYLFHGGFGALHAAGAGVLVLAIAAHFAGVIYHRRFLQDDLLQRMLPPGHLPAGRISQSDEPKRQAAIGPASFRSFDMVELNNRAQIESMIIADPVLIAEAVGAVTAGPACGGHRRPAVSAISAACRGVPGPVR